MPTSISTLVKKPAPFSFKIPQKSAGIFGQAFGSKPSSVQSTNPTPSVSTPAPTPVSHPQGTPKSSTITKTDPLGGSTVHQVNYQTGNTPGLLSSVQPKSTQPTSAIPAANPTLHEMEAASIANPTNPGVQATPSAAPQIQQPANNFSGYVQGGAGASTNAVNSGQNQIQSSTTGLLNTQNNPQTATSTQNGLLTNIAQNHTPEVTKAQNEYNTFSKASPLLLSDVSNNPNVAANVSVGRGQALGQVLSAEQQALQGNVQNALQGENQQIGAANNAAGNLNTAQGQGISAGSNVLGAGTTQQGQGIAGLGTSANYAKPELAGIGSQAYYNPLNPGQGGGSEKVATDINTLANSVLNNGMDYNTAFSQLSSAYGGVVANQLLSKIKESNPSFNPTTQSASAQTNAGLAGEYEKGNAQLRAASGIEPQIVKTLIDNPTLNNTPVSALTNLNQWFSGQTSDPAQQQLSSQVASYISALGMSPEQAAAIAVQKGGTIGTLLKTLKDNFATQNESKNPANVNKSTTISNNPSELGGQIIKTSAGDVDNSWFK